MIFGEATGDHIRITFTDESSMASPQTVFSVLIAVHNINGLHQIQTQTEVTKRVRCSPYGTNGLNAERVKTKCITKNRSNNVH